MPVERIVEDLGVVQRQSIRITEGGPKKEKDRLRDDLRKTMGTAHLHFEDEMGNRTAQVIKETAPLRHHRGTAKVSEWEIANRQGKSAAIVHYHLDKASEHASKIPEEFHDELKRYGYHIHLAAQAYRMLDVWPAGPNALTGRKTRKALSEKRDAKSKRFNEERLSEYQAEYKAIHKANPRLSYTAITDRVGMKFGVTGRAVRDQIPNPKK